MYVEESSFPFAGSLSWSLNALNCAAWMINFPALSTSWLSLELCHQVLSWREALVFSYSSCSTLPPAVRVTTLENRSTLSSKVDLLFSDDDVVMVTDFLTSGSSSLKMWLCSSLFRQV